MANFYRNAVVALLFLLLGNFLSAQNSYRGFSGGMMFHTGYLKSEKFYLNAIASEPYQIAGMPFGIGGALRFHFGTVKNQFRIGIEGYRSSIEYNPNDSYSATGWGGVFIDYIYQSKRVSPFCGVNFGGGGVRNLTLPSKTEVDYVIEKSASFRKYSFFAVTPFAGVEITLTKKLRFILKTDYLFNISNKQSDFASGFRVFGGIVFYRLK